MKMFPFRSKGAHARGADDGLPTAGCGSLTDEQSHRICEELFDGIPCTTHERVFFDGFLAGLEFVAVPKGEETYGTDALWFAKNALCYTEEEEFKRFLTDAAERILDLLDLMDEEEGD